MFQDGSLYARVPHVTFHDRSNSLLKGSFHISLTVLLRYWFSVILSLEWNVPLIQIAISSKPTRLIYSWPIFIHQHLTKLWSRYKRYLCKEYYQIHQSSQLVLQRFKLYFSQFTRRYYGNHSCFLFFHIMICLSPVNSRISLSRHFCFDTRYMISV